MGNLVASENQGLQSLVLRVLLNLSHDAPFRSALVKAPLFSSLVQSLSKKSFPTITIQTLYHCTLDECNRGGDAWNPVLGYVMKMLLETKGDHIPLEMAAVGINLVSHLSHATTLHQDNGIKFLMKKALKTKDAVLFKMLRTISSHNHQPLKLFFLDYVDDLATLMIFLANEVGKNQRLNEGKASIHMDVLVEVLGIFSTLTIPNFDYCKLAQEYNLLEFIQGILSKNIIQANKSENGIDENDDVLLEIIIFTGVLLGNEGLHDLMSKSTIPKLLVDLLSGLIERLIGSEGRG
jgi:hypothetical protein